MNEPEKNIPDSSSAIDLQEQVQRLQRLVNFAFLGLVVLSLTVTAYLGLQFYRYDKDLKAVRAQKAAIQEASKKEAPAFQAIVSQFAAYAQSHQDYADKVFSKYPIKQAPPQGQSPTGQLPPPGAPQK